MDEDNRSWLDKFERIFDIALKFGWAVFLYFMIMERIK